MGVGLHMGSPYQYFQDLELSPPILKKKSFLALFCEIVTSIKLCVGYVVSKRTSMIARAYV